MATTFYMKLFYETIDDPKMGRLSDHDWRRCVEFFMLAGELDLDGYLPDPKDMAWRLRTTEKDILKVLESLQKTQSLKESQIITRSEDGYFVTNFKKRQKRISDAARMEAYRDRKRKRDTHDTLMKQDGYALDTTRNTDIDIDIDTNIDIDIDAENEPSSPVVPVLSSDWQPEVPINRESYMAVEKDTTVLLDNIFLGVTSFYPTKDAPACRRAITLICERKNIPLVASNSEKIKDILRPFYLAWCKRKNKNGNPYSRTNSTWLTEWAVLGEIPAVATGKKEKTVADVIPQQSQEEKEAIKDILIKSRQEKPIPVEIPVKVDA